MIGWPTAIQPLSGVYVYSLNSSARLYNEGEKPVLPYSQPMLGPTTSVGASSANARVSGPSQEYLSLLANRPRLGEAADPADDCCQETLPTAEQGTAEQLFSDSSARLPSILRRAQP